MSALGLALALTLSLSSTGCKDCLGKKPASVDGVLVPQATGHYDVPDGATIAVDVGADFRGIELPAAQHVNIAIGRRVLWRDAQDLIARVKDSGKTHALLVGKRNKVKAMTLEDEVAKGSIITVDVDMTGKTCVRLPGATEAKCVKQMVGNHVSRPFVRELVREALAKIATDRIVVTVPAKLEYADVIRAVDGARTCCRERKVAVWLSRPPEFRVIGNSPDPVPQPPPMPVPLVPDSPGGAAKDAADAAPKADKKPATPPE